MPLTDWQFWIVTIIAAVALWMVIRAVIKPWRTRKGASTKTSLTIDGRKPGR